MIVGRKRELSRLEKAYKSKKAQFITIFGRRRIGKTYLIREFFESKECEFVYVVGLQNGNMERQLIGFMQAVAETFFGGAPLKEPDNWFEALSFLNEQIQKSDKKVVVFFDELPWLATKRSGLMQEIAHYWNRYWVANPRVVFIACGSSASWIMKKIIYDKGGLHNRTTLEIHLHPFTLAETRDYLESIDVHLSNKHVLALYMAVGGIPYYLEYVNAGLSAQENIQMLFFDQDAPLKDEFNKLFDSLFNDADAYKELIKIIAEKKEGVSRADLPSSGGGLTKRLKDFSLSGFIVEATPFGKKTGEFYRVVDEFCLFYVKWVLPRGSGAHLEDFWLVQSQLPAYYAWSSYAFEAVCMKHLNTIIRALKIPSALDYGWWRYVPKDSSENGAQIDLVIDRGDNAMTLCEIKYTDKPFSINKAYATKLGNNIELFKTKAAAGKQVFFAMVSASGLKETKYSEKLVSGVVTLDDLFNE